MRKTLPPVRGGSSMRRSNANLDLPSSTSLREPTTSHRNVIRRLLPSVLGLINFAAMLCRKRPILIRGHQSNAAMPFLSRLDQFQPEASPPTQQCQSPYASQGKGHHGYAEMPLMGRPSQPVLGHTIIAEMLPNSRPI